MDAIWTTRASPSATSSLSTDVSDIRWIDCSLVADWVSRRKTAPSFKVIYLLHTHFCNRFSGSNGRVKGSDFVVCDSAVLWTDKSIVILYRSIALPTREYKDGDLYRLDKINRLYIYIYIYIRLSLNQSNPSFPPTTKAPQYHYYPRTQMPRNPTRKKKVFSSSYLPSSLFWAKMNSREDSGTKAPLFSL